MKPKPLKYKVKHNISCDICDEWVTVVNKQDGIWVCKECDEKYPKYKK